MIDPVSFTNTAEAQGDQAAAARQAEAPKAQEEAKPAFTVELSTEAQAKLLKSEGQNIPEIAIKLRLDEQMVSNYLDVIV